MDVIGFSTSLPKSAAFRIDVEDESQGVHYESGGKKDFVAPNLIPGSVVERAPAALLVAAAAVGKSTCAREIAGQANALFLDLAGKRVGDGSFLGILSEALGDDGALEFRRRVRDGSATLVIDSLDETQLASGEQNFSAFVKGLSRFLRLSRGDQNVVLLARKDSSEWIKDAFESEGVGLAEYEIDYFEQESACSFLDLKLDELYAEKKYAEPPHRKYRPTFENVREQLFRRVAVGIGVADVDIWSKKEVRRFLGYSPVLESISTFLCVGDFRGVLPDESAVIVGKEAPEWRILSDLTKTLLLREQKRLQEGWLTDVNRPMFAEQALIDELYSPQEQCQRLVALIEGGIPRLPLPAYLPTVLRTEYEEAVSTQIRNHPFLSSETGFVSTVLRDFARAAVLTETGGARPEVRKPLLQALRSDQNLPSPALAPFIVSLLVDAGVSLPLEIVDILMSSFSAQKDNRVFLRFRVVSQDRQGFFEASRFDIDEQTEQPIFAIDTFDANAVNAITLPSKIEHLSVDFDGDIDMSASRASTQIGPNVALRAETLSCESEELRISGSVVLDGTLVMTPYSQKVRVFGDSLTLYASEIEGPLYPWAKSRPGDLGEAARTPEFYAFRRLLRFFRRTVHSPVGMLSADRDQLHKFVLNTDALAASIVAGLRRAGLMSSTGPSFTLDGSVASRFDLTFQDIDAYQTNVELQSFLEELVSGGR